MFSWLGAFWVRLRAVVLDVCLIWLVVILVFGLLCAWIWIGVFDCLLVVGVGFGCLFRFCVEAIVMFYLVLRVCVVQFILGFGIRYNIGGYFG